MSCYLLAQTEFCDQSGVTAGVFGLQVVQQLATAADHAQQAAATMVVFGVGLEVRGQLIDTASQQCHLNFRTAGVASSASVGLDDFGLD